MNRSQESRGPEWEAKRVGYPKSGGRKSGGQEWEAKRIQTKKMEAKIGRLRE